MTLSKFLLIFFLLVSTIGLTASSQTVTDNAKKQTTDSKVEKLRLSRQKFWNNLPKQKGPVNDFENIYNKREEYTLDSLIADFERKTKIQVVLVTFDTTMMTRDSLDVLTRKIGNVWGLGQKNKNRDVIIGICKGYRKMQIKNGIGIENILTDSETKKIIDSSFIPKFREGQYYQGTLNGLKKLIETLILNMEEDRK